MRRCLSSILVVLLAVGSALAQCPSGLTNYWKLNETSGARLDSVGSNNLVDTNSNVGTVAGFLHANAAYFNGSTGPLTFTTPLAKTQGAHWSISAWFVIESAAAVKIFGNTGGAGNTTKLNTSAPPSCYIYTTDDSSNAFYFGPNTCTVGTWNQILITGTVSAFGAGYTQLHYYYNGVDQGGSYSNVYNGTFTIKVLGGGDGSPSQPLALADVGWWSSTTLTSTDEATLWNGGSGISCSGGGGGGPTCNQSMALLGVGCR